MRRALGAILPGDLDRLVAVRRVETLSDTTGRPQAETGGSAGCRQCSDIGPSKPVAAGSSPAGRRPKFQSSITGTEGSGSLSRLRGRPNRLPGRTGDGV